MRDLVEVGDVLLGDRPVVSVFVIEGRELFFRRVLAQCGSGGTARLGLEKDEGDDSDQEDDDDCLPRRFRMKWNITNSTVRGQAPA